MQNSTEISTFFLNESNTTGILEISNFGDSEAAPVNVGAYLFPLACTLLILVGVTSNLLIIGVVLSASRMRTVTNYYIVNLAVTDLLMLLFCVPISAAAYVFGYWPMGDFMCRFVLFIQQASVQTTCITLTIMSIDRYAAIVHPIKSLRYRTRKVAAVVNASIWPVSYLISIPAAIFNHQISYFGKLYCIPVSAESQRTLYIATFLSTYAIPILIITVCYSLLLSKLWSRRNSLEDNQGALYENKKKQKKKVTMMILIIIALFAVCWLPIHAINFKLFWSLTPPPIWEYDFKLFALTLAYGNSCVNPFVYNLVGGDFRNRMRVFLATCLKCGKVRHQESEISHTQSRVPRQPGLSGNQVFPTMESQCLK